MSQFQKNDEKLHGMSHLYLTLIPIPRTKQSEQEVQKIIHLQGLANQLPDAFIDSTKVLDPRTKQSKLEVQKIIHLQGPANQLTNAFIDSTKVTKSHIPA